MRRPRHIASAALTWSAPGDAASATLVVRHNGRALDDAFTDPSFVPVRVRLADYTLVNLNARVKLTEAISGAPDDTLPKAEGDVPAGVGAVTGDGTVPTFSDLNLDSETSVALVFGASIIAITIGMQIASIAGRLVRQLPDLPDVKVPGIGR